MSDQSHHKFSHAAMASPFDILVAAEDKTYAGQAADAAFDEIDTIEREISRFVESSDLARINHAEPDAPIRVGIHTFECLRAAKQLYKDTGGTFDVSIGPLMSVWRNPDKSPRQPSPEELEAARQRVGLDLVTLNEADRTVVVHKAGVQIDFGGIGKGYAVTRTAEILEEWEVESALINAGNSTVYAMEPPPGEKGWVVGAGGVGDEPEPRRKVYLHQMALSGSGFSVRGRHIMDPHTGKPVMDKLAAWAQCPSATLSDALSTAFTIMTPEAVEQYCKTHPDTAAILILPKGDDKEVLTYGTWQ